MKKYLILFILIMAVWLSTEEVNNFKPNSTLQEISAQTNIPLKKITQYLELNDETRYKMSIQELGITIEEIHSAIAKYNANKNSFYTGIALVGMGIVFTSLLLVGIIINSLQHLNKQKKKIKVKTSVGTVSAPAEHINSNGIIAAITTILLHDTEESSKIELTWKRRTISMWKASGMVGNRVFDDRRGI